MQWFRIFVWFVRVVCVVASLQICWCQRNMQKSSNKRSRWCKNRSTLLSYVHKHITATAVSCELCDPARQLLLLGVNGLMMIASTLMTVHCLCHSTWSVSSHWLCTAFIIEQPIRLDIGALIRPCFHMWLASAFLVSNFCIRVLPWLLHNVCSKQISDLDILFTTTNVPVQPACSR